MSLPLDIDLLLGNRVVESNRIEYKEGWNPDTIYRTICAFANDFYNTGGGYLLVGIREKDGVAERPVLGLSPLELANIQTRMIGFNNLIRPTYHPKIYIEEVDGKQILVIWVPGGSNRPYEVPEKITAANKDYFYYIRQYANSVKANQEQRQELITLANQVPFDDRPNLQASTNDISMVLVQDYLRKTGSKMSNWVGQRTANDILDQMSLLEGPLEHQFPRNVALMLFSESPKRFFPYTYVELVHFPQGTSAKDFSEKVFDGPIPQQILQSLEFLKTSFLSTKITKIPGRAEALRRWNYPFAALEEAVANCLFHRNYQEREPVKIRIEPNRIILYNAGGPDRSISREAFAKGAVIPRRYRNRRLGGFLKELGLTEGHGTGIPSIKQAMEANGSPDPIFEFDEDRTWFQVILPIHELFLESSVKSNSQLELMRRLYDLLGDHARDQADDQADDHAGDHAGDQADDQADDHAGDQADDQADDQAGDQAEEIRLPNESTWETMATIVTMCADMPLKRAEIFELVGLRNHHDSVKRYLEPLESGGLIAKTIPEKPKSPNQRYRLTEGGKQLLQFK